MDEALDGIATADARLGRPFPLPTIALPLARWVEIELTEAGAEVAWNLDDTRAGAPGRLALYAGTAPPPPRVLPGGDRAPAARRGDLAGGAAAGRPTLVATGPRAVLDGGRAAPAAHRAGALERGHPGGDRDIDPSRVGRRRSHAMTGET